MYSVNGHVSDAATHARIESARVELRATTGGMVGSNFSRGNGEFQFDNVPEGVYTLVVDCSGYESESQQVEVSFGPVYGLDVELRAKPVSDKGVGSGAKVSVRELSIPHKAHDAMKSGLSLLYGKSDAKASLKQFQRAIQEYPDYYEAYAAMGVAYMKLQDTPSAEDALHKSIEVSHEKYAESYYLLADLYCNGQRFADAEPLARKAVELDPSSGQANSELGRALVGLDRPAEAEKSAAAAVKLDPNNPLLYLLLANVHMNTYNYPALLDDLNGYLKLAPDGPFAEQVRKQREEVLQRLVSAQPAPQTEQKPHP